MLVEDAAGNIYDDGSDNIDVGGGWNPATGYNSSTASDNIDVGGGWNPATGTGDQATADAAAQTGVTDQSGYGTGTWDPSSLNLTGIANLLRSLSGGSGTSSQMATLLPLLAGLYSASQSNNRTQQAGYQGGIPTYTATRATPGEGQALSGNVLFSKPDGTVVNPNSNAAPTARVPVKRPAYQYPTYEGSSRPGGGSATSPTNPRGNETADVFIPEYGKDWYPAPLLDTKGTVYTPEQEANMQQGLQSATAPTSAKTAPTSAKTATGLDGFAGMVYTPEQAARDAFLQSLNPNYRQDREADMQQAIQLATAQPVQPVQTAAKGGILQAGGFVIPADVVSHFGNGSSDAGLKLLASKIGAQPIKGHGDGMSDSIPTSIDGKERALVAHEEAYLTPQQVAKIGGGDASKGAQKLRDMMARIREARTGNAEQGKQINPAKFMPGGSVQRFVEGGSPTAAAAATGAGVTGTEESLANWAGPYVTDMLAKGQALSEMPYEQYGGPLTAGASPLQAQAFNTAGNLQVPSGIGQAANTAGGLATAFQNLNYTPVGSTFDTAAAQQYMNPYLSAALDPQLKELQRQNQIANMTAAGQLTKAGAFGGGRQAVMNAENQRNMLDKTNALLSQGYSTAYDKAMAQFNADQGRKVQEAQFGSTLGLQGLQGATQAAQTQGQLGNLEQQANLTNLTKQAELGAVQRGIASEDVAAEKAAFEEARNNPYKMVQFQQSLLQGLPLAATTYNQAPTNNLTQFAQGLTTLQAALKSLGVTP